MPHIRTIAPEEATGSLKRQYDAAIKRAGRVFNIVSLQSLNPRVLDASIRLYATVMMGPGPLERPVREMLATATARELNCFYWTEAHGEDLRAVTHNAELATQVKRDYCQAPLDRKTRSLLDYAVQITRDPQSATAETIEGLRQVGWTDEEILTATHIIGFFNYYVCLADPLGVEPEEFMRGNEVYYQKKSNG